MKGAPYYVPKQNKAAEKKKKLAPDPSFALLPFILLTFRLCPQPPPHHLHHHPPFYCLHSDSAAVSWFLANWHGINQISKSVSRKYILIGIVKRGGAPESHEIGQPEASRPETADILRPISSFGTVGLVLGPLSIQFIISWSPIRCEWRGALDGLWRCHSFTAFVASFCLWVYNSFTIHQPFHSLVALWGSIRGRSTASWWLREIFIKVIFMSQRAGRVSHTKSLPHIDWIRIVWTIRGQRGGLSVVRSGWWSLTLTKQLWGNLIRGTWNVLLRQSSWWSSCAAWGIKRGAGELDNNRKSLRSCVTVVEE